MSHPPPPDEPPPTRPPGNPLALGCLGFVAFYAIGFFFLMIWGVFDWGVLVPIAIAIALTAYGVRRATPAGRAKLARFAVGFAVAAVVFGGCLALLSNADFR